MGDLTTAQAIRHLLEFAPLPAQVSYQQKLIGSTSSQAGVRQIEGYYLLPLISFQSIAHIRVGGSGIRAPGGVAAVTKCARGLSLKSLCIMGHAWNPWLTQTTATWNLAKVKKYFQECFISKSCSFLNFFVRTRCRLLIIHPYKLDHLQCHLWRWFQSWHKNRTRT